MKVHPDLLDQYVPAGSYIRHRGRTYCVRRSGSRALTLLRDIAYRPEAQSVTWLLRLRPRIRRVLAATPPVALACVIDTTTNLQALRLAIWICGRSRCFYARKSIARQAYHDDFRVRREAIRSLRRLSAWVDLANIADGNPDPRTREIAKPVRSRMTWKAKKPYSERLADFLEITQRQETAHPPGELVIAAEADIGRGKPPRSGSQIRRVLRRIRLLVRRQRRRRWLGCLPQPT